MQAQAIRSTRLIGRRPTLDLRVNHPDHNYYAEGVVVSNSHATSYAYMTAATSYLKAKHPQAFYLSCLMFSREEPNPTEAANIIISEMSRAGVPLMPPDLVRSDMDFTIEGQGIRFGLASIKGISEMTFSKLGALRGCTFESKFDLFDAAKGAAIQINMLCGLIYCGCLTWGETTRTKLALEAQTYNLLTDAQKTKVKQYGMMHGTDDIIAILKALPKSLNEKGKPLIPESQIETLRRKYAPYWTQYQRNLENEALTHYVCERHYLGFSHSQKLFDIFSEKVLGLMTLDAIQRRGEEVAKAYTASRVEGGPSKGKTPKQEPVKAVCYVDEAKHGVSRANGSPYLKVMLSDDTGTFMAMLYGEERLEACRSFNGGLPEEGDLVICSGVLSKDGRLLFLDDLIRQECHVMLRKAKEDASSSAPTT